MLKDPESMEEERRVVVDGVVAALVLCNVEEKHSDSRGKGHIGCLRQLKRRALGFHSLPLSPLRSSSSLIIPLLFVTTTSHAS